MFHTTNPKEGTWATRAFQPRLLNNSCFDGLAPFQLPGDPYRESDTVTRCCTLVVDPSGVPTSRYYSEVAGDSIFEWSKSDGEVIGAAEVEAKSPWFWELARPRELPFGNQEVTSLVLDSASASEAAASTYEFLTTKVFASSVQVRPEKFSIKADVFQDVGGCPLHCALKVRVFHAQNSFGGKRAVLVEFCRRHGDLLAFCEIFRQASNYIRGLKVEVPWSVPSPVQESEPGINAGTELVPLISMLSCTSKPMQAEAAAALLALATSSTGGSVAIRAALGDLHGVLANLCASAFDVACPAGRLAGLLGLPESVTLRCARQGLADGGGQGRAASARCASVDSALQV